MTNPSDIQVAVHPIYAVPLLQARISQPDSLNQQLRELFLSKESQGDRYRNPQRFDTQYGIFESDFDLHTWHDAPVKSLFQFIRNALLGFIQGINDYSDQQMSCLQLDMHSWFHVTRAGGFQGSHIHPNASWSAIYCVDPGDDDSPAGGAVRFQDPRQSFDMFRDPANDNLKTPYKICPQQLKHIAGQMIGFPSYLSHEVFPYFGKRPRIVVALNAWSRWKN